MQRLGIANHERAHWLAGDPMVAEHVAVRLAIDSKPYAPTMFTSNDEGTIYASLMPKQAQDVIGKVGRETRGVEKLLRRIGFQYCNRIDPFDGGPHFRATTDEIVARLGRGEYVDPAEYYFRTHIRLSTGAPRLMWLNDRIGVSTGAFYDGTRTEASYSGRVAVAPQFALEPSEIAGEGIEQAGALAQRERPLLNGCQPDPRAHHHPPPQRRVAP